jgi:hypothetical protein
MSLDVPTRVIGFGSCVPCGYEINMCYSCELWWIKVGQMCHLGCGFRKAKCSIIGLSFVEDVVGNGIFIVGYLLWGSLG